MLAERYEAVSSERMLAEVLPVIPDGSNSKLALDVGAGTGRDAAWLTSVGYQVVAAEPAAGMRRIAAEKHRSHGIRWVSDTLPSLDHVHGLARSRAADRVRLDGTPPQAEQLRHRPLPAMVGLAMR